MARIRTIKPEFFMHEEMAELPMAARLLFIGLFTQADRRGRLEDIPKRLKACLLPYDDVDVDALLTCLHERGFIIRYQSAGFDIIQVINFEKHQYIRGKEADSESKFPAYVPEDTLENAPEKDKEDNGEVTEITQKTNGENTGKTQGKHEEVTGNKSRSQEGKGKERKGNNNSNNKTRARPEIFGNAELLTEAFRERAAELSRLYPAADIPQQQALMTEYYRARDKIIDPYLLILKWFSRIETGKQTAGGDRNGSEKQGKNGRAIGFAEPNPVGTDWLGGSEYAASSG